MIDRWTAQCYWIESGDCAFVDIYRVYISYIDIDRHIRALYLIAADKDGNGAWQAVHWWDFVGHK